ncbi:uncharacterized protein [Amphiura filiformis]|uniref:uncharacterized protein n=1 Tax=Amphiura filiformis TaxID=82378 RepID=UPI003B20C72B
MIGSPAMEGIDYTAERLTSAGGKLQLSCGPVTLDIPSGALNRNVYITMSIISPDTETDLPSLGDKFLVAPIVRLTPDSQKFKKPVTLTVGHSAEDLTRADIQVWYKSEIPGDNEWKLDFDGESGISDPNVVVLKNKIKLRIDHLCIWCIFGLSSLTMHILPYVSNSMYSAYERTLTVFVVSKHQATIIEEMLTNSGSFIMCCRPKKLVKRIILQRCRPLRIEVKGLKDMKGSQTQWEIKHAIKEISTIDMQLDGRNSSCDFKLRIGVNKPDSLPIAGIVHVSQIYNYHPVDIPVYIGHDGEDTDNMDALTEKLSSSRSGRKRDHMEAFTEMPSSSRSGRKRGMEQVSDLDIKVVVGKANLTSDNLTELFTELEIPSPEVESAKFGACTSDVKLQSITVLRFWRQTNGRKATRRKILDALRECGFRDAKEILEEKWNL